MPDVPQQRSGGIGFVGLLTIMFIGLKLTGFIDWSWWWVLAPVLIAAAVVGLTLAIAGGILAAMQIRERRDR